MTTILLATVLLLRPGEAPVQVAPDWGALETLRDDGKLEEALELLESWRESGLTGDEQLRSLAGRQELLHRLGRYSEAQQAGRPWIDRARQTGDLIEEARAFYSVGRSFGAVNSDPEAAEHFQAALEAVRRTDDRQLELEILLGLSFPRISMAQYRDAQELLERAESLWRTLGEEPRTGTMLWQRKGTLQLNLGNHRAAAALLKRAVELARKDSTERHIAAALTNLAQAHMRLNNWVEAIDVLKEAIERSEKPEPIPLATLGICHFELNQFDERLSRAKGSIALEAWATAELGLVAKQADQDFARALSLYDKGIEMFRRARNYSNEAIFVENKGHLYRDEGGFREALRFYDESERKLRSLGLRPGAALLKGRGQVSGRPGPA